MTLLSLLLYLFLFSLQLVALEQEHLPYISIESINLSTKRHACSAFQCHHISCCSNNNWQILPISIYHLCCIQHCLKSVAPLIPYNSHQDRIDLNHSYHFVNPLYVDPWIFCTNGHANSQTFTVTFNVKNGIEDWNTHFIKFLTLQNM